MQVDGDRIGLALKHDTHLNTTTFHLHRYQPREHQAHRTCDVRRFGEHHRKFSDRWRLSRLSWTRSIISPSAAAASLLDVSRSLDACADFKTDGNRFGSTPDAS